VDLCKIAGSRSIGHLIDLEAAKPMSQQPQIHTIVSPPFDENSYVVWLSDRTDAIIIDPGFEPESILAFLRDRELKVAAILNTHGHLDHISGNQVMKNSFPEAPLIIGAGDQHLLTDEYANMSAPLGMRVVSPEADLTVHEGDSVERAGLRFDVFEVPGHSPGHVVYVYRGGPTIVFGGDVLFRGSIGRYDMPGADGRLLISGIRNKLFKLPADTLVYPGHGPVTTIGFERRANPFVGDNVVE
jgi:glyoxylase-like metal-dependent hydrolase (beta-lactamase superfamily II)